MAEPVVDDLPGGLSTAAGGTRNEITLDRPWQVDIQIDSNCPFETTEQRIVARYDDCGGWWEIENPCTPFSYHLLILPKHCWPKERLRCLGGVENIAFALQIAQSRIAAQDRELWLGVHVGAMAGQNKAHLHYHLLEPLGHRSPEREAKDVIAYCASSPRVIMEHNGFRVVLGGVRAGQCFIVPQDTASVFNEQQIESLAAVLDKLIRAYADRFSSKQGLPPDFQVGIKFASHKLAYGCYTPILNNWGFTE